ncbi:META domain-containing protein [Pedobacter gandavensis]|uniref:META domain-containing protein n=1 Tax=Pedobacter gandavensis TaxID=2679963 RepID=UPI00292DFDAA|nr:META domain-containing protein [Pedobacter gandavensis]
MKKAIFAILISLSALTSCKMMNKGQQNTSENAAAAKLSGNWELNYITGVRIAFTGLYPGTKPSIDINAAANELSGNTSCNSFGAKLEVKGSKLKVDLSASPMTMRHCEGEGEMRFLEMLKKVDAYTLDGNTLTLMMGDVPAMKFTKK